MCNKFLGVCNNCEIPGKFEALNKTVEAIKNPGVICLIRDFVKITQSETYLCETVLRPFVIIKEIK